MLETRLDRKIDVSHALMRCLDSHDALSTVLPRFKTLAGLHSDGSMQAALDILIYGHDRVPNTVRAATGGIPDDALEICWDLLRVPDGGSITTDSVRGVSLSDRRAKLDKVISLSVFEMERITSTPAGEVYATRDMSERAFQLDLYHNEVQKALSRVRAFLNDYAGKIWQQALRDKDYVQLLGPDYRLVLDSLGALDSLVGDQLLAALEDLYSDNTAKWALSALGCRNVVLKLGRLL